MSVTARVRFLDRRAKMMRGDANDARIRQQINDYRYLMDFTVNPRGKFHLDGTKLSLHKDRVEALARGEHVAPILIDMAMTQKCSYACTFCYAGLQQNPQAPVPWKVYEQFIEDCAEIGVKAISLVSDGESTENPDFIKFIRKCREDGIVIASGTNGLKLTELETLVDSLTYLRINFNAADPARYSEIMGTHVKNYHKVVANVRELVRLKKERNSNVTIGLQMVLLPEYADEVIPLALLGRELGVDYLVIKHTSDDADGSLGVPYAWYKTDIATDLFKAAEALSTPEYSVQCKWSKLRTGKDRKYSKCFGTALMLQMSGTGLVAPCGSFFHEKYKRYHIGDIKDTRFKDIWNSPEYKEVINFLASDQFDPRKMCATLCLQDSVNNALFSLIENDIPLPTNADKSHHGNFI